MSSHKLQDLFYMVLMAGNFLNSVSVFDFIYLCQNSSIRIYLEHRSLGSAVFLRIPYLENVCRMILMGAYNIKYICVYICFKIRVQSKFIFLQMSKSVFEKMIQTQTKIIIIDDCHWISYNKTRKEKDVFMHLAIPIKSWGIFEIH